MNAARCACLATTLPMVLAMPQNGLAADWLLTPRARAAGEFVDNPQLLAKGSPSYSDGLGDVSGELAAELAQHQDHDDFSFAPRLSTVRYPGRPLLNQFDQFLDLAGDWRSERTSWTATVDGTRDTTLTSELGVTGLTGANRYHQSLQAGGGPSYQVTPRLALSTQLGWQANHYVDAANTGLFDYRYQTADARASYAVTERTTVAGDFNASQINTPRLGNRTNNYSVTLSLSTQLSERWAVNASGGPSLAQSNRGTEHGVVYQAGTQLAGGERTDWSASIARTVTPTGRGALTRSDQLLLDVEHRFSERLRGGFSAQASQNRDLAQVSSFATVDNRVRYLSLEGHLAWAITPEWGIEFSARQRRQLSSLPALPTAGASGYSGNIAVTWNGQSWALR